MAAPLVGGAWSDVAHPQLRVTNTRSDGDGWAPRYRSGREAWMATAAATPRPAAESFSGHPALRMTARTESAIATATKAANTSITSRAGA
jgi:hypothetical protein